MAGKTNRDHKYDYMDLTYTLISMSPNVLVSTIFYIILLSIRYYTLLDLIYIGYISTVKSGTDHFWWLLLVILTRLAYLIVVVKVSLKIPTTKTEVVLKKSWNSIANEMR